MSLAWNTRQLLAPEPAHKRGAQVEFHFLSRREIFDNTIKTVDRHHSGAGEWAVYGDHCWYTVAVITRPVYALPQELCLSFDCFSADERIGDSTLSGPPIEDVALEFGTLLSLLVREPLLPLGSRRIDGKPIKFQNRYGVVYRPPPANKLPATGIDSKELRTIVEGLANASGPDADAILAASRLYHAALSLSAYDVSTAYFSLVSSIECLAGHHFEQRSFKFDEVEKFAGAREIISQIDSILNRADLIDKLKLKLLNAEHFVSQKFRALIEEFLPEEFWRPDELHPTGYGIPAIEKADLRKFVMEAYAARSTFAHTGEPFPAHVEFGIGDWVSARAGMQCMALIEAKKFVPVFVWFERLTHLVLREYLYRVIAPAVAKRHQQSAQKKIELLAIIKNLPRRAIESLERLTRWTAGFVGANIVGPRAPNREWALDEASIECLYLAEIIDADSRSMEGTSTIKNREIGEVAGEFFFGAESNPLKGNTILN